jgi:hypothetical protein
MPASNLPMRISRNYKVEDWKGLSFTSEADWCTAVTIFLDRLETRYLEHVRSILSRQTSSFSVLALDSTLIETLEQFRRGKAKTPSRKGQYYFESFLTETAFSEHFDVPLAQLFYKTIRCGLLHQSEAGQTSRLKRGGDHPVVAYTVDHKGVVINTRRFHKLLEEVIQKYAEELRNPESVDARKAFRRKMNYICRIESEGIE